MISLFRVDYTKQLIPFHVDYMKQLIPFRVDYTKQMISFRAICTKQFNLFRAPCTKYCFSVFRYSAMETEFHASFFANWLCSVAFFEFLIILTMVIMLFVCSAFFSFTENFSLLASTSVIVVFNLSLLCRNVYKI